MLSHKGDGRLGRRNEQLLRLRRHQRLVTLLPRVRRGDAKVKGWKRDQTCVDAIGLLWFDVFKSLCSGEGGCTWFARNVGFGSWSLSQYLRTVILPWATTLYSHTLQTGVCFAIWELSCLWAVSVGARGRVFFQELSACIAELFASGCIFRSLHTMLLLLLIAGISSPINLSVVFPSRPQRVDSSTLRMYIAA